MNHYELIPSELQDRAARVYLESDHDARQAGEWREDDTEGGMRVAAYVVLCAMFVVAGVVIVAVMALLQ